MIVASVAPFARDLRGNRAGLFIGIVTSVLTFALTALFVRWEGVSLGDVGARPDRRSYLRFALGFLAGGVVILTWAALMILAGGTHWTPEVVVDMRSIGLALLGYLSLASREELAFRGFPLFRLMPRVGLWPAQVIVAIVFALEHKLGGATWTSAFLGAGVGSLLFGMAAIASRGLAMPIGIHAAWNFGHWALGMKESPGIWKIIGERPGISETAIYDVVMLAAAAAFWWWGRSTRLRDAGATNAA